MRDRFIIWAFALLLITGTAVTAQSDPPPPPPDWLIEHMTFMTESSGVWITDNSAYMSEQETAEEYGTEWDWGLGKGSISGRLFARSGGEETAEYWRYTVYWHPGDEKAMMLQLGAGGIVGIGPLWLAGDGVIRSEMTFYYPGRGSERLAHDLIEESSDTHVTRSYGWTDGEWRLRRTYTWKRSGGSGAAGTGE